MYLNWRKNLNREVNEVLKSEGVVLDSTEECEVLFRDQRLEKVVERRVESPSFFLSQPLTYFVSRHFVCAEKKPIGGTFMCRNIRGHGYMCKKANIYLPGTDK